uniref:Uncharacterized protein n=1 Tax=Chenopodium quinoa TaxID=63459 RepID=A0A803MYR2_CHEQI
MVLTRGGFNGRGPIIRRQPNVSSQLSSEQTPSHGEMNDNSHMEELYRDQEEMENDDADGSGYNENEEEVEFPNDTGNPDASQVLHKTEGLWFHSCEVVDEVVETSYKTYFMGPWINWAKVLKEAKAIWAESTACCGSAAVAAAVMRQCCSVVVTVLLQCCGSVAAVLLQCCCAVAVLLRQCCCCAVAVRLCCCSAAAVLLCCDSAAAILRQCYCCSAAAVL